MFPFLQSIRSASWLAVAMAGFSSSHHNNPRMCWPLPVDCSAQPGFYWASSEGNLLLFHTSVAAVPVAAVLVKANGSLHAVGPAFAPPPPRSPAWSIFACCMQPGAQSPGRSYQLGSSTGSSRAGGQPGEELDDTLHAHSVLTAESLEQAAQEWLQRTPASSLPQSWSDVFSVDVCQVQPGASHVALTQPHWVGASSQPSLIDDTTSSRSSSRSARPEKYGLLYERLGGEPLLLPPRLHRFLMESPHCVRSCLADELHGSAWAALEALCPIGLCGPVPTASSACVRLPWWDIRIASRVCGWVLLAQRMSEGSEAEELVLPQYPECHAVAHCMATVGAERVGELLRAAGATMSLGFLGAVTVTLLARTAHLARVRAHAIAARAPVLLKERQSTTTHVTTGEGSASVVSSVSAVPVPGMVSPGAWSVPAVDSRLVNYLLVLHKTLCHAISLVSKQKGARAAQGGSPRQGPRRTSDDVSAGISEDDSQTIRAHDDMLNDIGLSGDAIFESLLVRHHLWNAPLHSSRSQTYGQPPKSARDSARASMHGAHLHSVHMREPELDFVAGVPWVLQFLAVPNAWVEGLAQADFSQTLPTHGPSASLLSSAGGEAGLGPAYPATSPSVHSAHTARDSAAAGGVRRPPLAQSQVSIPSSAVPSSKVHPQPQGLVAASKAASAPSKSSRLRVTTHSSSNASSSVMRAAAAGASPAAQSSAPAAAPTSAESAPNTGASRASGNSNPNSSSSSRAEYSDTAAPDKTMVRATARDSTGRGTAAAMSAARKPERSAPLASVRGIPLSPHSRRSFAGQDGVMWGDDSSSKTKLSAQPQAATGRSFSHISGAGASEGSADSGSGVLVPAAGADYTTPRPATGGEALAGETPFSLAMDTPVPVDVAVGASRPASDDRGSAAGKALSAGGSVLSRSSSDHSEMTASLSRGGADSALGSARSGFIAIPKLTLSPTTRNRNSAVLRTGGDVRAGENTARNSSSVISSARGGDTARRSAARVTITTPGQWAAPSARGIALDRIASSTTYGGMHGTNWANQSVISMAASQAITVTGVAAAARRVRAAWSALLDSDTVQQCAATTCLLWTAPKGGKHRIAGPPLPPALGLVGALEAAAESATIGASEWWSFWRPQDIPAGPKRQPVNPAQATPVSDPRALPVDHVMGPLVAMEAVLAMQGRDMSPKKLVAFPAGKPLEAPTVAVNRCCLGLWGHLLRQLPGTSRQEVTAAGSIDYSLERQKGPEWDFPDLILQVGASLQPVAAVVERQPAFALLSDHAAEFSSAVPAARALPLLVAAASDAAVSLFRDPPVSPPGSSADTTSFVAGCCLPQSWAPIVAPITAWDWLRPMVRGKRIHTMPMNSLVPLAAHSSAMTTAAHEGLLDALRRTILAVHSAPGSSNILQHIALPLAQSAVLLACIFGAASSTLRHPRLIELLANHDKLMPVPPLRLAAMRASVGSCLLSVSSALAAVASAVQQCSTALASSLAASADSNRSQQLAQALTWVAHWGHGAAHMSVYSIVLHLSGLYTRAKQAAQQRAGVVRPVFPEALLAGSVRLLLQCAKAHDRAASLWHLRDLAAAGVQPSTPRRSLASSQHKQMARSAILSSARLASGLAAWRHLPAMSLVANPLTDTSHAATDLQLAARVAASMPSTELNAQHAFPLLLDADGMAQLWIADGTRAQCAVLQHALQQWIVDLATASRSGDSRAEALSHASSDGLLLLVIQGVLRTNRGTSAARPVSDAQRAQNNPSPDSTDTVLSVRPAGSHPGHGLLEDSLAAAQNAALRQLHMRPSPHKRRLGAAYLLGADLLDTADSGDAASFAFETSLLHDAATTSTLVSTGFMTIADNLLRAASAPIPAATPSIGAGIALSSEGGGNAAGRSLREAVSGTSTNAPSLPTSPLSSTNSAQKGRPPMPTKTPSLGARGFGMLQGAASGPGQAVTSPTGSAVSSNTFSSSRSRSPKAAPATDSSTSSGGVASAEAPVTPQQKPVQYIDMDDLGGDSDGDSSWDSDGFEIGGFLSEPASQPSLLSLPGFLGGNTGQATLKVEIVDSGAGDKTHQQVPGEKPVHVIDMGSGSASTVSWGSDSEYNLDGSFAAVSASEQASPTRGRSSSLGSSAKATTPQRATVSRMGGSPGDPSAHPNPRDHGTPPVRKRAASSAAAPRVSSQMQLPGSLPGGIVIPRLAVVDKADAAASAIGGVAAGGVAGAIPSYALPEHLLQDPVLVRVLQNPAVHVGLVHAVLCALITVGGASLQGAFSRRFPAQEASTGHPHAQLHPPSAAALKGGMLVFATESLATSTSMDARMMNPHKVAQTLGDEPAMLLSAADVEDEDEDGDDSASDDSNEDVVVVVSKPFSMQLDSRRLLDFDAAHARQPSSKDALAVGGHSQDRLELSVSDDGSAMGTTRHSTVGNDSAILQELPSLPGAVGQSPQLRAGSAGGQRRPKRHSGQSAPRTPSKDTMMMGLPLSSAGRMATGATQVSEVHSRVLSESMASMDSNWSVDDGVAPLTPHGSSTRLPRVASGAILPLSPPLAFGQGVQAVSGALASALQHQAAAFQQTTINHFSQGRVQLSQRLAPLPLPSNIVFTLQKHLNQARFAPLLPGLCRLTAASGLSAVRLLRLLCRGCMDVSVYGEGARLGSGAYGEVVEVSWVPPLTPSPTPLVAMAQQNLRMWSPSLAAFGIAPETPASGAAAQGHSLRDGGGPAAFAIAPPRFPLAAKQVQLPKSADDQIAVGDLFTSATLYQHVLAEHHFSKLLPPIPRLWDFGLTADSYWLVTERCATNLSGWRHSLGDTLTHEQMPLCLAVFAAVARGVHWLHERGVTHYDLKADNVLLRWKATPKQLSKAIKSTLRPEKVPMNSADDPIPHSLDSTAPRWLRSALSEQLASEHATAHITGHRPRERTGHNTDQGAADDELRSYSIGFNPSDMPTSPTSPCSTFTGNSAESVFVRHLVPNHLIALTDFGEITYTPGLPARAGWCGMSPGTECIKAPEVLALGGRDRKTLRSMDIDRERLRGSTHTADVWSLGCMLIELLTGKSPFADECENEYASFYTRVTGGAPPGTRSSSTQEAPASPPPVLDAKLLESLQCVRGFSGEDDFGVMRLLEMCFTRDPVRRASADVVAAAAEVCAIAAARKYL